MFDHMISKECLTGSSPKGAFCAYLYRAGMIWKDISNCVQERTKTLQAHIEMWRRQLTFIAIFIVFQMRQQVGIYVRQIITIGVISCTCFSLIRKEDLLAKKECQQSF